MDKASKLKVRHKKNRFIWFMVSLISLFLLIISIIFIMFDIKEFGVLFYIGIIGASLFGIIFCLSFLIFLLSLRTRCLTFKVNTHVFYVCVSFFTDYLIFDDTIVDRSQESGFTIPPLKYEFNGIKIYVKLGSFGGVDFKVNERLLMPGESINIKLGEIVKSKNFIVSNDTLSLARELEELESLRQRKIISDANFKVLKDELIKKYVTKK